LRLSKEHVIYPIIVGIVLAVVGLVLGFVPRLFEQHDLKVEVEACIPNARIEAEVVNKTSGTRTSVDATKLKSMVAYHIRLINAGKRSVEKALLDINFYGATKEFETLEIIY
jgi:hypothetical protein